MKYHCVNHIGWDETAVKQHCEEDHKAEKGSAGQIPQ